MTDPEHPSTLPALRTQWTLVQPLLAALSQAGIALRPGDLDQLYRAAALGPDFAQALARWIRTAHAQPAPPARTTPVSGLPAPVPTLRIAPAPTRPALAPPPPDTADRQAC
ncbi:hypothetical protein ACFW1A_34360 [Kitasatospora sp. NPDC058965]|uniref:hypothetical protein n=1 Tax=Kitasatospora sp. NPDC058965 TaxID=3346682 RepID=UPI003697B515